MQFRLVFWIMVLGNPVREEQQLDTTHSHHRLSFVFTFMITLLHKDMKSMTFQGMY